MPPYAAAAVAPDEPLQAVFDEVASMIIERGHRMPLDDVVQQESLMVGLVQVDL